MEEPPHSEAMAELEADRGEMLRLVAGCTRKRVVAELQPWLTELANELEARKEGPSAAPSEQGELQADLDELLELLEGCNSARVRRELQPWCDRLRAELSQRPAAAEDESELRADVAEMASLIEQCGSARVRRELEPWCERAREKLRHSQGEHLEVPPSSDLPVVAIVGDAGTGKRRLLGALAGLDSSLGQAEATIATKYYTARVKYVALDLDAGGPVSTETVAFLQAASALVLLWDLARPGSFASIKQLGEALGCGEEECEEGPERVQLCVAVEPSEHANADELDQFEDEARSWCAGAGFEHLRCALGEADLKAVRKGCLGAGLLLGADCDGTALRVREALECQLWPNFEPKEAGRKTAAAGADGMAAGVHAAPAGVHAAPSQDTGEVQVPVVVVAGARGLGKRRLVEAFATGPVEERANYACAEALLETKYYCTRLRFMIVDTPAAGGVPVDGIEAFVLLWDTSKEETFAGVCELYERSAKPIEDSDESDANDAGVRLCVALEAGEGQGECPSTSWCLQHGFEALRCSALDGEVLKALGRDWRSGSGGKPLLAPDDDGGAGRIVEALQCHTWPGLAAKSAAGAPGEQGAAAAVAVGEAQSDAPVGTAAPATPPVCDQPGQQAVERMEQFVQEIRQVREIKDENDRRNRACDVAMQLAASLGIDESDDDDL